jgi:hypothetical protein
MASLESGVGYFYLDTVESENVPDDEIGSKESEFTLSEPRPHCNQR